MPSASASRFGGGGRLGRPRLASAVAAAVVAAAARLGRPPLALEVEAAAAASARPLAARSRRDGLAPLRVQGEGALVSFSPVALGALLRDDGFCRRLDARRVGK